MSPKSKVGQVVAEAPELLGYRNPQNQHESAKHRSSISTEL